MPAFAGMTGRIVAVLGLAVLLGGMVFFAVVMAPLVFLRLPAAVGDPFIRGVFPWYYCYCAVSAGVAACGFLLRRQWVCVAVLLVVVAAVVWAWVWLIPSLDAMRAAGDAAGFDRGHTVSVWLNGAEMLVALILLLRTAVFEDGR
jgi:hypothetical protein